jgi:tRNA(adenine34) deaminase|tara:strand:- start:476 stop:904 length:429 start_codon:yes stop_codon:yes gene_type:complete
MQAAIDLAKISYENNEVPVGAIVVLENNIIGKGRNSVISDKDVSAHAEINAIRDASRNIGNYRLINCSIYVTLEPCHMCAKAISDARIDNLVFATEEPKTGSIVSIDNIYDRNILNHSVQYQFGLLKDESSKLLKNFFKDKR